MICRGCNSSRAYAIRSSKYGETCNECGDFRAAGSPDVYFRQPYLDPNLPHPSRPHEANGVWVESKRHKAALLAEQNLCERGDKRHGSRI